MIKLCLIAPELAPFTTGGIGVLLHNLIREYEDSNVEFHVLAIEDWQVVDIAFKQTFPNATLWKMSNFSEESHPARKPPQWAFTTHPSHYKSYQIAGALNKMALQGVKFDIVEFPDWGGLAFCSCQEKLLGGWGHGEIAIRLHSTDSILRAGQPVAGGAGTAHLADLERKALRDADIVVAHLGAVAKATKDHFGFDDSWSQKLRIDAPPIAIQSQKAAVSFDAATPICFPSKIQALKRPEVFLNGMLAFLNSTPEYHGNVIFMAHPTDNRLREQLLSRIPPHLKNRVSFSANMAPTARTAMLGSGICVFPSPFESFCLTAYEASALGGWVVLNQDNPAFSERTTWTDNINCLKFDGTGLGLAECLHRAWQARKSLRIYPMQHEAEKAPYWLSAARDTFPDKMLNGKPPLVSVVVPYFNMGMYIERTIESIFASSYSNLEVIIIDDCSTDRGSQLTIREIQRSSSYDRVKIFTTPANLGLSAARNLGVRNSLGRYILTLDSDDTIRDDFIDVAVSALDSNQDYSLVVPQTAIISDESSPSRIDVIDYILFVGESIHAGAFINRFSTATSLGRRELYEEFPYDENLTSYEDWDFYLRASSAGKRFIVTNEIYFYYRRRNDSMISQNNYESHNRNLSLMRAKQRVRWGCSMIDMSILTDVEAYQRQMLDHSASSSEMRAKWMPALKDGHAHEPCSRHAVDEFQAQCLSRIWPKFILKLYNNYKLNRVIDDLRRHSTFDCQWYLEQYPDVAAAGMDPARHFILHGRREGRLPNSRGAL
ncbi:glycosyltransferase [Sphingomonas sp. QA11]|uniref:glycosyltransferase n=1 Tax=Sphingomonas sp. QA11 TaxID=2950605 RepID=UPI002349DF03|nr:glycosyltransferase [Sphingomonas sp. QA11]WCM25709.1 glycosyltransferase [Sphingomonas sp. QA11]